MKLYLVKCRGMNGGFGHQISHGLCYVVADNPGEAYEIVRNNLNSRDLGFSDERELHSVTLLAEERNYPKCGTPLHIKANP
jgi:hypothetical protein